MKKNIIVTVVIVLIVGAGAFYGGMRYDQSTTAASRQVRLQQFGAAGQGLQGGGQRGAQANGTGFTSGDIISKDSSSITVQMRDGGSKIVFFSDSTPIMKTASGTPQDLATGQYVMVTGSANQDGSITAQSIQLRPNPPANSNSPQPTNQ